MNTFAPELSALMIILRIGRTGDLDAAVLQICGDACHRPIGFADFACIFAEIRKFSGIEPSLAIEPLVEQLPPAQIEALVQLGD